MGGVHVFNKGSGWSLLLNKAIKEINLRGIGIHLQISQFEKEFNILGNFIRIEC